MKKLLLTSVIIAAISAGGVAIAKPFGSEMPHHVMRHQAPVKEIVKSLRGLSLSDTQREEIKALVIAFKNSAGTFEDNDNEIEMPSFDFATATEAQLRTFIQSQLEEREAKHFALAQLRYNIFSVLDDAQQQELLTRQAQREDGSKRSHDHADSKGLRKGEFHQHGRAHADQRGPFGDIELSDEQIASLQTLKEAFKTTAKANRETMRNFKDAQRELVLTQTFSQDTWDALLAKYKDELVEAGVAKAKHRQAMFAVLTESQQAEVKAKREEEKQLRGILSAS